MSKLQKERWIPNYFGWKENYLDLHSEQPKFLEGFLAFQKFQFQLILCQFWHLELWMVIKLSKISSTVRKYE